MLGFTFSPIRKRRPRTVWVLQKWCSLNRFMIPPYLGTIGRNQYRTLFSTLRPGQYYHRLIVVLWISISGKTVILLIHGQDIWWFHPPTTVRGHHRIVQGGRLIIVVRKLIQYWESGIMHHLLATIIIIIITIMPKGGRLLWYDNELVG